MHKLIKGPHYVLYEINNIFSVSYIRNTNHVDNAKVGILHVHLLEGVQKKIKVQILIVYQNLKYLNMYPISAPNIFVMNVQNNECTSLF